MDLPAFYETAATLSLVLLGGAALVYRDRVPASSARQKIQGLLLIVPPLLVLWFCLSVLGGFWGAADFWRWPVLYLVVFQAITGIVGLAGYDFAPRAPRDPDPRRRWWSRRPHSQPHKPDRTEPDQMQLSEPVEAPDRTRPDQAEPEQTGERHS
jgi:hypothetical protein